MADQNSMFSVQLPALDLPAPAYALDEQALKEWAWLQHKDLILEHLIVQSARTSIPEDRSPVERAKGLPLKRLYEDDSPMTTADTEQIEESPAKHLHLLATIAQVQRQFFRKESPRVVFGVMLEALLNLMESEYGFIGEIKYETDGTMYLQTHAITNIAWDKASRQFYQDNINEGLRFTNLKSLFGTVMTTGEPVLSSAPRSDPRACGLPHGHPPLKHFLGIPFFKPGGEINGMVGISNKPGGYTEKDIAFLEPFTVTCGNLIHAYLQIAENRYLINTLEDSVKKRTSELERANTELEEANRKVRLTAKMQLEHFACMSHEIRTPLNCIIGKNIFGNGMAFGCGSRTLHRTLTLSNF